MLVKDYLGKNAEQEIWKLDEALVSQINATMKQAAIEEGQWSEKREMSGHVDIEVARIELRREISCSPRAPRSHEASPARVAVCCRIASRCEGCYTDFAGSISRVVGRLGEEGCRFLTKGFLLCGKPAARLVASADRFARTPALTCSAELACWFSQTHVLAKGFASPLAGKAPYR